jgi:DNA-binding NtrC family response regulator
MRNAMFLKNRRQILIVDDEPMILEALCTVFEKEYRVHAAPNAKKALELLKLRRFSVAIVDILMKGMNGEALLTEIKKAWPLTQVVIITASDEAELEQRCYEKGAYDFVAKPFNNKALLRTVRRAAEQAELARKVDVYERQLKELDSASKRNPKAMRGKEANWETAKLEIKKLVDYLFAAPKEAGLTKLLTLRKEIDMQMMIRSMAENKWNQLHSAKRLGIFRGTIVKKLKKAKIPTRHRPR